MPLLLLLLAAQLVVVLAFPGEFSEFLFFSDLEM